MSLPRFEQILLLVALTSPPITAMSAQLDIHGPAGSGAFGSQVIVLDNGNFVVSDPEYDAPGPVANVGAVHLYSPAGNLISTLTGTAPEDRVGESIFSLEGRFIVMSPQWNDGALANVGAVTWIDGSIGLSGSVSVNNSLVGASENDRAGQYIETLVNAQNSIDNNFLLHVSDWDSQSDQDVGAVVFANISVPQIGRINASNALVGARSGDLALGSNAQLLNNGKITLSVPRWDNGSIVDAGAVIFIDPQDPPTGQISETNALVGSSNNDSIGIVVALANGNYVVRAPRWNNGGIVDAGAVVWADGDSGVTGTVSVANALVGTRANDQVGTDVIALVNNGNYVVCSPGWDSAAAVDVGAATWANGVNGIIGTISIANSLLGAQANDRVASSALALENGHYTVSSFFNSLGAVTWANGNTGITGTPTATNSLVGSLPGDDVLEVIALENSNYVVASPNWGSGDRGAVTWADGTVGRVGSVSATNSLIGGSDGDRIGMTITPLSNGNFVVASPLWDSGGVADVGAVTHVSGSVGSVGVLQASESLIGSTAGDRVGGDCDQPDGCVYALAGGRYIVLSPSWDLGSTVDVGAVTWSNGATGALGLVSVVNSLVGSSTSDQVGETLSNMSSIPYPNFFLAQSYQWNNGAVADVGAITLFGAGGGPVGPVSEANSLIGSSANDRLGYGIGPIDVFPSARMDSESHFSIQNLFWDNGTVVDAGAVTFGHAAAALNGRVNAGNSVLGAATNNGRHQSVAFDIVRDRWIVGRPIDNIVSLFNFVIFSNSFE